MSQNQDFIAKTDLILKEKRFYEFGVAIRGMAGRKLASKKYDEFENIIKYGIIKLREVNEENFVAEILFMFLTNYSKYNQKYDEKYKEFIKLSLMGATDGFIEKVLSKAIEITQESFPDIFEMYCEYAKEKKLWLLGYNMSIKSGNLKQISFFLDILLKLSYKDETGLIISKCCLELILVKNIELASNLLNIYSFIKTEPLINFVSFVIQAMKVKSMPLIYILVSQYSNHLLRDPVNLNYIDKICLKHFDQSIFPESPGQQILKTFKQMFIKRPESKQ